MKVSVHNVNISSILTIEAPIMYNMFLFLKDVTTEAHWAYTTELLHPYPTVLHTRHTDECHYTENTLISDSWTVQLH